MRKETENWLAMVEYDLITARHMLGTGRYVHDLIYLVSLGKVELLSSDLLDFIGIINNAGIVTRYPEDLSKLITSYPKEVAEKYLNRTEEMIKCLKQDLRLRK